MELHGAFDLHVHCAPDTRPRKMTALELVHAARDAGMRGLLLKNHDCPTVAIAAVLRETVPGILIYGGLVLNDAVGGFNLDAVDTAIQMGAAEIWMPTHCAAQERAYRGRERSGLRAIGDDGLVPELKGICKRIAEAGAILGTGHFAPAETVELVRFAREVGVRKILITHPEINFVNMPVSVQKEIAGPGVFFERCFVRDGFALDWDGLAASIREVGVSSTVLATDLGQPENPDPISGLLQMKHELRQRGFSEDELRRMMCDNAAYLLAEL